MGLDPSDQLRRETSIITTCQKRLERSGETWHEPWVTAKEISIGSKKNEAALSRSAVSK